MADLQTILTVISFFAIIGLMFFRIYNVIQIGSKAKLFFGIRESWIFFGIEIIMFLVLMAVMFSEPDNVLIISLFSYASAFFGLNFLLHIVQMLYGTYEEIENKVLPYLASEYRGRDVERRR